MKKTYGIVHINIEQSGAGKVVPSHNNFNIDCKDFLKEGFKICKIQSKNRINEIRDLKKTYKFKYNAHNTKYMENVLHHMYNMTKDYDDNIIFTTGGGNHQMQTYQFINTIIQEKIIS